MTENFSFLFAYIFVLISIFYLQKERYGIQKELFISSIRGFVQLFLLSFILLAIFESRNPIYIPIALLVMILFATYIAKKRVSYIKRAFIVPLVSISAPSILTLGSLLSIGALEFEANIIIPVAGMVIGNALNSYTLVIDRLRGDIKKSYSIIEGMLSLGVTLKIATLEQKRDALKSSLHPIINNLQTLGIVFIPGMMSGLLIAGASPFYALSMQMMIMYLIVATSLGSALIASNLTYKELSQS